MKSNKQSILMVATLLLLAGCGNDNEGAATPEGDGRVALQVTSNIHVQPRAYNDTWESGDAIGIYMLNGETTEAENYKYTTGTTGTSGTPPTPPTPSIFL